MKKMPVFPALWCALASAFQLMSCDSGGAVAHDHQDPPATPARFNRPGKQQYAWLQQWDEQQSLLFRMGEPEGFHRVKAEPGSFAEWLRLLPVLPGKPEVLLFNGEKKGNQEAHELVFNVDVGDKDLQQCADAVMRLRAEYLFSKGEYEQIHFNFTSGHPALYTEWRKGMRPQISGNSVTWKPTAKPDESYAGFRRYLESVFNYCGTASLAKEMKPVADPAALKAGDVFIRGGFPGHAVIVVDVAADENGKKVFLLAQSYMPAQQIHLLRNPSDPGLSPWYPADFSWPLSTPEWTFDQGSLMRF